MGRADSDSRGRPVVVVTGVGVLTSLGAGKQDNWRELTAGHSGIRRISRFPDRRTAHQHRRHDRLRAGRRGVGAGPVGAPRRNWSSTRPWPRRPSARRATSRDRCSWRCRRWSWNGHSGWRSPRRPAPTRPSATTTCCAPRRAGSSSATTSASCSARWPRTWRCASAPRARRWRPPQHARRVRPRSSSASRRSGAARPRRRW